MCNKLSRSVWLTRLLRLPVFQGVAERPGALMIQIDGLARQQLEHALEYGEMPFLGRLIHFHRYKIHTHYSGLPSTTPAVQAELFYGIKTAVPAFSFRDRDSHDIVCMYTPEAAAKIEAQLDSSDHLALLQNGSAYADNFTGGATESHFCPSSMGWGPALRSANPLVVLIFLLGNLYSFVRVAILLCLEVGLAFLDFGRGIIRGQDFFKELKFIPARVAISILLRELCVIGGKIDISRGLPIIHINFLGYDEQAHRRGPDSLFAHWTLKGIDDAIARLWRSANRAEWRNYDIWIYSDHGQAETTPYHQFQGYPLQEAVRTTLEKMKVFLPGSAIKNTHSIQTQRFHYLGGDRIQRLFAFFVGHEEKNDEEHPSLTALGPVGHVYLPQELTQEERGFFVRELVDRHAIPVVIETNGPGMLRAWTRDGRFDLPQDSDRLFGAQHPFIAELGDDLVRLCKHPVAGDFVLLGWREGVEPLTFAEENGSHAGASPEETSGFALFPPDVPLPETAARYLRPSDLRNSILKQMLGLQDQATESSGSDNEQACKAE